MKLRNLDIFHVLGDFCANISRSMRPKGKIVGVEDVPLEISYKLGHSRVSLDLPSHLEIHQFKDVKFELSNFATFSATFLANISRSMRPR